MNKKILGLLLGLMIIIGGLLYDGRMVEAIGAMLRSGGDVTTGSYKMQTTGTTTDPLFLQNGTGTTSLTFASDNFHSLTMYVQVFASSTNVRSPLNIRFAASDDDDVYFDYDPTIIDSDFFVDSRGTSTIAFASTTKAYEWQPATRGATSTKVVNVNFLPARYTRVTFTVASSTPTGGSVRDGMNLWANFIGQIENAR